jgi:hypothetical protein
MEAPAREEQPAMGTAPLHPLLLAFSVLERRSYASSAFSRQGGSAFALSMTLERSGPAEAPPSMMYALVRELSARTTAERLAAFALRQFLADGVPPSRAALERLFDQTQEAVEKGAWLALGMLQSQGAGAQALRGVEEMAAGARGALVRWRAEALAQL